VAAHPPRDQGSFDFGAPPSELVGIPDAPASETPTSSQRGAEPAGSVGRVVRVRPDEPGLDKLFDYAVPAALDEQVRIGSVVRIALAGRRVRGWVVADDVEPPEGVELQPLAKVTGWGPPSELLELADWAAWRWAGRPASVLRTATSAHAVRALPRPPRLTVPPPAPVAPDEVHDLAAEGLAAGVATLRLPPAADPYPVLVAAAALGPILVVGPVASTVRRLGLRLRRAGLPVALMPDDWAAARAGASSVFGPRAAAWAPIPSPAAVLVVDEHDQSLQQEQAPTWHARDVLIERARRLGVPCLMVSPAPSLEALELGPLLVPSRAAERAGWPLVEVVDRRGAPPGEGLFSERLVQALRSDARVVCILNRKGRSRLTSCAACGGVATCERCQAAVVQAEEGSLSCTRCGTVRPVICTHCGATRMKNLRAGVSRVREELEALAREPVGEVTADAERGAGGTGTRIVIGTEAALHQLDGADVVAFLDLDQELLAPRYRAAEEAFGLLVRAARLVGGRSGGGRLLLQTRQPRHEVVQAAVMADPSRVALVEADRRRELAYPPATAMAVVSGPSAPAWVEGLGHPAGVEVLGPADGRWLLRAPDHATLCAAMAQVTRPPGRVRVEVDPLRL
jgi:primosomal protein N' (replication factor Y) (superfamily II helicase)